MRAILVAAVLLAPCATLAKPPPGYCDKPSNKAECSWFADQRQWDPVHHVVTIRSCCGAPGSDGHILEDGDLRPTNNPDFPYKVRVYWPPGTHLHVTWIPVPETVITPAQDLPEPNAENQGKAKIWYAATWGLNHEPIVDKFRFYCLEIPTGS